MTNRSFQRIRERGGDLWQASWLPIIGAAALGTLVLGYLGATQTDQVADGIGNRVYFTLRLFALEGDLDPPIPGAIQVARLGAAILVGYAALSAALALFREESLRLGARLTSEHTVIVGLGERGVRLATALRASEEHSGAVVLIERDPGTAAAKGAARAGIPVFVGDASDHATLRRAGVRRARHIVLLTGNDLVNLEVAETVAESLAPVERRDPLVVHVAIRDLELWRALRPESVRLIGVPSVRVEFTSIEHRAAEELVDQLPDAAFLDRKHLVLVVEGPLGEEVLGAVVRRAQLLEIDPIVLSVVGAEAATIVSQWGARHPHLDEVAVVKPVASEVRALAPTLLASAMSASGAVVALTDERVALAAALHLRRKRAVPADHLAVAVSDHEIKGALIADDAIGMRPVGVLSSTLNASLLKDGTRERLARAKHEHYLRRRSATGEDVAPTRSLGPWRDLDNDLLESNRQFADRVGDVIDHLGAIVVPATVGRLDVSPLDLPVDVLEEFAEREHDGWAATLRARGYVYGRERNDNPDQGPLTHSCLVHYRELPPDEKEKDRESVRDLPALLAEAGLRLVVPTSTRG